MPFSSAQIQEIGRALKEKGVKVCPACQQGPWSISDGLIVLQIQQDLGAFSFGGPALPNIAIICSHCGNTQFHNVFVLGVAEALGVKSTAETAAKPAKQEIGVHGGSIG
jgi:hypothetical protein